MGGLLIIEDGRGIFPASWAFDAVIEAIAEALPSNPDGKALREWVLNQRCQVLGPGTGCVDVRELTPQNRILFWRAAQKAFAQAKIAGPHGWSDPSFFPGWLRIFHGLMRMRKLYLRGEPPEAFNPYLAGTIPPTGHHCGPGWNTMDQQDQPR